MSGFAAHQRLPNSNQTLQKIIRRCIDYYHINDVRQIVSIRFKVKMIKKVVKFYY